MQIMDDVLTSLDLNAEVRDVRQGIFQTGVLTRNCGLASTLTYEAFKQETPLCREPGSMLARTVSELICLAYSPRILEAAVGMAAINSLIEFDSSSCRAINAAEILAEKGRDGSVALIGHFPFVPMLKARVKKLWVIEKSPRPGDSAETETESILQQADVVGVTGTSFTNHTLEDILYHCRPDAYLLMLGDTTPMSPILFDYGFDALCGVRVIDPESALNCVSQGANFRQLKGIELLTMFKSEYTPIN